MVRSRGASRKPLRIFPEDLPMRMFYARGPFLRGTGAAPSQGTPSAQHSRSCIPSHHRGMPGLALNGQVMGELTGWAWADPTAASATWEPRAGVIPGEEQQEPQGPAPLSQECGRHSPFICLMSPYSNLLLNCPFDRRELWAIPRWTLSCPYLLCWLQGNQKHSAHPLLYSQALFILLGEKLFLCKILQRQYEHQVYINIYINEYYRARKQN